MSYLQPYNSLVSAHCCSCIAWHLMMGKFKVCTTWRKSWLNKSRNHRTWHRWNQGKVLVGFSLYKKERRKAEQLEKRARKWDCTRFWNQRYRKIQMDLLSSIDRMEILSPFSNCLKFWYKGSKDSAPVSVWNEQERHLHLEMEMLLLFISDKSCAGQRPHVVLW